MKTKKKLLIALLSAACLTAGAFGLTACGNGDELKAAYDTYVAAVTQNGGTALSYDDWLAYIKTDITPNPNENLDKAYQAYVAASGQGALSFEDWSALIQGKFSVDLNGKTIQSSSITDKGEFILKFTDNTTSVVGKVEGEKLTITFNDGTTVDVNLPKVYAVTAVDNNNNPVANAWFKVGYISGWSFVPITDGEGNELTACTNDKGIAYFSFFPKDGIAYEVRLADYGETEYDLSVPDGYEIDFGTDSYGTPLASKSFGEDGKVTVDFTYIGNSFVNARNQNKIQEIKYKRTFGFTGYKIEQFSSDKCTVSSEPLVMEVKNGEYHYFSFDPYVSPSNESDNAINDNRLENATKAATGKYTVSYTVSPATAQAAMYCYSGQRATMQVDENGIPTQIQSTAQNNSITINARYDIVRNEKIFGFVAQSDCTVTVTVERISDATEPTTVYAPITLPDNIPQFSNGQTGTLTLVPINGTAKTVKGTDNYYHVGSATGPLLLINLGKTISRLLPCAIKDYPAYSYEDPGSGNTVTIGDGCFKFIYTSDDELTNTVYDYNEAVKAYAAKTNSAGVIPVDQIMYDFLHSFGGGLASADAAEGCAWLAACQYYAPEGGLNTDGDGTQASPYILLESDNAVQAVADGLTYIKFTAERDGAYSFTVTGGVLSLPTNGATVNDKLYVPLKSGDEVVLQLSNASGSVSVTVAAETKINGAEKLVQAEFGDDSEIFDDDGNVTGYNYGAGTRAETAVSINTGLSAYIVNTENGKDGVYVKFQPMFLDGGTFAFEVAGSYMAQIVYNGTAYSAIDAAPLTLDVKDDESVVLLLTAKSGETVLNGIYLINIYKTEKSELSVGNNSLTFTETYADSIYSFTAEEAGDYSFTVTGGKLMIADNDDWTKTYLDPYEGKDVFYLSLTEGQTVTFAIQVQDDEAGSFILAIESGVTILGDTAITIGEPAEIETDYEGTLTVATEGTYTVSLQFGPSTGYTTFTVYISDGTGPAGNQQLTFTAGDDTKEVTLAAGEYTVAVTATEQKPTVITISLKQD